MDEVELGRLLDGASAALTHRGGSSGGKRPGLTTFWRGAFWAAVAFTLVMALLPHPPEMPVTNDKLQHAAAFATLTLLGETGYRRTGPFRLLLRLSTFGAVIELLQALPMIHRDCDPMDWLTDTAAAAAVAVAIWWWRWKREQQNR